MGKDTRQLVKIVKEICEENAIDFKSFSYDWILQLSANGRKMFIYGYKFPNNNASIEQICNDKSALSDILAVQKIPHVEHHFFMSPNNARYTGENGDWDRMEELLYQHKAVVCKANTGTGGKNVFKVDSKKKLEMAVHSIFSKDRSLCIAPYRNITSEYRVIIVNSTIGVIYEKHRPAVIGNGVDTTKRLIENDDTLSGIEIDPDIDLNYIPASQEKVEVSWKHNLGQGAKPVIVVDNLLQERLSALALSCVLALDVEFASVDIIESENGLEVLEVNSGIMMESFSQSSPDNYAIAKEIYKKAIFFSSKWMISNINILCKDLTKSTSFFPFSKKLQKHETSKSSPTKRKATFPYLFSKMGKGLSPKIIHSILTTQAVLAYAPIKPPVLAF